MNCLSYAASYTWGIFRRTSHLVTRTTVYGCYSPSWKTNFENAAIRAVVLDSVLARFRFRCYSSRRGTKISSRSRKLDTETVMELEKDAFYVVRKGDIIGVYRGWSDCQAQVGSSICDPPVSVYKGCSLSRDSEEYLASHGLKNAIYTIRAADLEKDIFGSLVPCTFHVQDESSLKSETSSGENARKRSSGALGLEIVEPTSSISTVPLRKNAKLDHTSVAEASSSDRQSCILEFDGASKGNPGPAGAGAVLRAHDGSLICRLREGLGIATNNVAEYRAMLLGLKYALKKGFTSIRVQGDSKLVCMQVQGLWKVKNQNMSELCKEAYKLKDKFLSFQISHVLRGLNSEADAQANLAISLAEGQVLEEFEK